MGSCVAFTCVTSSCVQIPAEFDLTACCPTRATGRVLKNEPCKPEGCWFCLTTVFFFPTKSGPIDPKLGSSFRAPEKHKKNRGVTDAQNGRVSHQKQKCLFFWGFEVWHWGVTSKKSAKSTCPGPTHRPPQRAKNEEKIVL